MLRMIVSIVLGSDEPVRCQGRKLSGLPVAMILDDQTPRHELQERRRDEFNIGVYNSYDTDDSGVIEEPEFGDIGDDMGDGGFWDV